MLKKFICLAKSARERAWCIAGKEVGSEGHAGWIRPIGREKEALTINNLDFGVGSILSCDVDSHSPTEVQKENFVISEKPNWKNLDTFPKKNLVNLLDYPDTLWEVGNNCSSAHGYNDRVAENSYTITGNSLYFIKIDSAILIKKEQGYDGESKKRMRMIFKYNDNEYSLVVTCLELSERYWSGLNVDETVEIGPSYITVSLAKPFYGFCYKVVAGHVFA